jgi:myosin heavy subunit
VSDYRKSYDAKLAAINSAIESMPGSLDQHLPGFTKPKLKRFFQRFSLLLGRLDKSGAKQPQYLYWGSNPLVDVLQTQLDQSISNMGSGAGTFVSTNMHQLVQLQDRLERAVGTDIDQLKQLAPSISSDLSTSVQQADDLLSRLREEVDRAREAGSEVASLRKASEEAQAAARDAAEKAGAARRTLEELLNPDARFKSSLESLARRARERMAEVDEARDKLKGSLQDSASDIENIKSLRESAEQALTALGETKSQAEQILNLSSQAGLAASYRAEQRALETKTNIFTGILYLAAVATIIVAAFYVLPGLQQALATNRETDVTQALVAALLRASVLAPLVYVIYFTTKRISSLETLRMDYAEKAAASLAYSGYREQMNNDEDLLRQLKGSLLSKFHDHPERLLRPGSMSSSAKVKTPGFEAETHINMQEDSSTKRGRGKAEAVEAGDDEE